MAVWSYSQRYIRHMNSFTIRAPQLPCNTRTRWVSISFTVFVVCIISIPDVLISAIIVYLLWHIIWHISSGIVNTLTSSKCASADSLHAIRISHIYDSILQSLQRIFSPDVTSNETIPRHTFMCGVECRIRSDTFMNMCPNIFFMNCQVIMDIGQDGRFWYMCKYRFPCHFQGGALLHHRRWRTHACRVRNPRILFFTFKGTQVLRYFLSRNYCGKGK
jgi:hypothetical protein